MSKFKALVEHCRTKSLNKDIHNSAWDHALILFDNLFQSSIDSKEDVCIVTGTLNPEFYQALTAKADACMENQHIELIVLDPEADLLNNSFAQAIEKSDHGTVTQAKVSDFVKTAHFMLVGKDKYRLEVDHERTKALANFHNKLIGSTLSTLFGSLKEEVLAA